MAKLRWRIERDYQVMKGLERHVVDSLETLQILIARALMAMMVRCPCCGRSGQQQARAG